MSTISGQPMFLNKFALTPWLVRVQGPSLGLPTRA
jgi:hypothetical protein